MATLGLPAIGYGLRYDFGIFNQKMYPSHKHPSAGGNELLSQSAIGYARAAAQR